MTTIATAQSVNVRVARPSDLAAIQLCIARAFEGYIDRIGRRPSSMDRDFMPLILAGDVYVCEADGRINGAIAITSAGDHLEVGSVAVDPAAQRRGIGKHLMALAEEVAVDRGFRVLRLHTNAALPELVVYYERLGYRVVESKVDAGFDRIFLQKVLPTTLTDSLRMPAERIG